MASPLFCQRLLHNLGLQLFFRVHLLQATVLVLQLFQASHQRGIHPTERGGIATCRRSHADVVLPAQGWSRGATLCLLQDRHDLAVSKLGFAHIEPPRVILREFSTFEPGGFLGGLPAARPVVNERATDCSLSMP